MVYKSGSEASEALRTEASVKAEYLAVSGSGGFEYGINKNFKSSKSYYMYTYGQDLVQTHVSNWGDAVNDKALHKALRPELKKQKWDPNDADTVSLYRNLFSTVGTHIVTGAAYGSRLSLVS